MKKEKLQGLLDAEVDQLSRWSYARLIEELSDILAYQRGSGPDYHQFEVQMIECEPNYVHISVAVDDGSLLKSISPISRSFIVHRDGRVEL